MPMQQTGQRVLIVDDLLATGGTVKATIEMIERLGGVVAGCAFLIELDGLNGREAIEGYDAKVIDELPRIKLSMFYKMPRAF